MYILFSQSLLFSPLNKQAMSVLGLTYAVYVTLTAGALVLFSPSDEQPSPNQSMPKSIKSVEPPFMITVGRSSQQQIAPGKDGFVSLEYRPHNYLIKNFKPLYAVGFSEDGAAYATMALRKDFKLGPLQITPYIGPALYQRELASAWKPDELLQFRTGFSLSTKVSENMSAGGGFYHISNAQNNEASADIDVTHLSFTYAF